MTLAPLTSLAVALAFVAAVPQTESRFSADVTETHFAATNPNNYSVLLMLGDSVHGARAQMLVAPFATFETSFPQGTLDDLYIEGLLHITEITAPVRLRTNSVIERHPAPVRQPRP